MKKDLYALMTDSQEWWPADWGHYGGQDEKVLVGQPYGPSHGNSTLFERLTPRELEIILLLRGPARNKEIAKILDISYETVRRHTANIYGKLGVNGRWNAVARAEELNILPPR